MEKNHEYTRNLSVTKPHIRNKITSTRETKYSMYLTVTTRDRIEYQDVMTLHGLMRVVLIFTIARGL